MVGVELPDHAYTSRFEPLIPTGRSQEYCIQELRNENKCVAAILADTSAEWQTSAQAVFMLGMPVTTVYTTLGHEAMLHGLNETEAATIFLDWMQYFGSHSVA